MRSAACIALVALVACGDDGSSPAEVTPETRPETEVTSGCTPLSPDDLEPLVFDGQDDVSTSYSLPLKTRIGVPAADYLVLQFINYNERIDAGAGTFALDEAPNDNFGTCPECIAIWVDQASPNLPPGKFLFQSSGSIRLDLDPRTRRLVGRLEGVVFREIAVDEMTLSSTFVEGGDCVELTAPLDFDFRYVPPEWTCPAASYFTADGCDCNCGTADPDCDGPLGAEPITVSADCAAEQACIYGECLDTCDALAKRGCDGGVLCTLQVPEDVCLPGADGIDAAAIGQDCQGIYTYCAVTAGLPAGLCSNDGGPSVCRPLCASKADCGPDQYCYTIVGGYLDGDGKGYCMDGPAPF